MISVTYYDDRSVSLMRFADDFMYLFDKYAGGVDKSDASSLRFFVEFPGFTMRPDNNGVSPLCLRQILYYFYSHGFQLRYYSAVVNEFTAGEESSFPVFPFSLCESKIDCSVYSEAKSRMFRSDNFHIILL